MVLPRSGINSTNCIFVNFWLQNSIKINRIVYISFLFVFSVLYLNLQTFFYTGMGFSLLKYC